MPTLRFYTYIHRRATDGLVFYVGKGHSGRAHSTLNRNKHWKNTFTKHGIIVEIVAYWFSEEAAFEHEKTLIAEYRKLNQPLCNMTDGGEGPAGRVPSAEHRANLSAALTGKKLSAETKAKLKVHSDARIGTKRDPISCAKSAAAHKGHRHSAESLAKMSAAQKGRVTSPETKEKLAAALRGRKRPPEVCAKISAAKKGVKQTPEQIQKNSEAHKGIPQHPNTRAGLLKAITGRKVSDVTREKMRASALARPFKARGPMSKETREKIGAKQREFRARQKLEAAR